MPPAARASDMHVCPMVTGVVPHVGGPILPPCSMNVITGSMPQARVTDMLTCAGGPDVIAKGSMTVLVNNLPAARMGDITVHGGNIVIGFPTVIIGDSSGGGGGGGGRMGSGGADGGPGLEGLLSTAAAMAKPLDVAKALIDAADLGVPFVERC